MFPFKNVPICSLLHTFQTREILSQQEILSEIKEQKIKGFLGGKNPILP